MVGSLSSHKVAGGMNAPQIETWPAPEKLIASGTSLLMIGAVLWPIVENWRKRPKDNFPFSYYPMFSMKDSSRARVTYLVGIDGQGNRCLLSYTYAGRGGMNQVRKQIRLIARQGRAEELCRAVSSRIARSGDPRLAGVVTVQVVTGEYRLADFFAGRQEPVWEKVHASWDVRRARE